MNTPALSIAILGLNYAPEDTGIAPYTASLAQGLVERGNAVHVITSHPHYPEWERRPGYSGWSRRYFESGVRVERKSHYVPKRPSGLRRAFSELSFGVRLVLAPWAETDVLILVSPALFSSALALIRARLSRRPRVVVVWVQDLYSLGIVETGQGGRRLGRIMGRIESFVLRRATGVVVIHDRFKKHVVDALGVPAADVVVLRNWSHLPPTPVVNRADTRRAMGWKDGEIVVLHSGNMGAKQGLENVINAARYSTEEGLPLHFVLMGGGNQRDRLVALGRQIEGLSFVDSLSSSDYQAAMASADVLLVNEKEGVAGMAVPSKLTSYFGTGLPVLAATDPGSVTRGEIEASGGGISVDAGDPRALAKAADSLGRDFDLSRQLGAAGLAFRIANLSESAAIDRYAQWLIELVAKRRR